MTCALQTVPENLTAGSIDEDIVVLTAFRFHTIVRDYTKPEDHRETRLDLLEIANRFPELNITTYQWYVCYFTKRKMLFVAFLRVILTHSAVNAPALQVLPVRRSIQRNLANDTTKRSHGNGVYAPRFFYSHSERPLCVVDRWQHCEHKHR